MEAELIFAGGPVISCDDKGRVYEEMAVARGRIAAVGRRGTALELRGPRTEVIDLAGRAVIPGIIDSHCHVIGHGLNRLGINLKHPVATSIDDIQARVRRAAAGAPRGTWLRGWGYDHSRLKERRHPTRWDIDAVAPDHPVVLSRTCGHIAVLNSNALTLAGITRDTGDPPGGRFDRSDGLPTGAVYGAALSSVSHAWAPGPDDIGAALEVTVADLLRHGITSVHDAGSPPGLLTILSGARHRLAVRVGVMMVTRGVEGDQQARAAARTGLVTGFGNERARIGPYKIVVDGSSSGPTARTRKPYTSDPGDSGILYVEREDLSLLVEEAHAGGFQVTVHAVGDHAIEMFLDVVEGAQRLHPRTGCRHRIEHCAICPPDLMDRIEALEIIPVAQPVFFHEFGDGYLENYGPERVRHMFPARSFLERGIPVAASSDFPVTTMNPMLGISTAMTRRTVSGSDCFSGETVDLMSALGMYTRNGAYASFEEDQKGSIEPGKLADLAVLSGNPLDLPPEEIAHLVVDMTLVDGRMEYGRDQGRT